jgi:GTP-binding protein
LKISAEFLISAAGPQDFPRDGLAEVAMVGRSNVGKSSLINALVRQKIARTSGEPGKTRLVNVYRVARGSSRPFLLVDLPGFGYARRAKDGSTGAFEELSEAFFSRGRASALLLVDTRHPGLENDRAAWQWLHRAVPQAAVVGTKIDKLSRGERIRALKALESAFEDTVLPVSAVTGEGLDELWKLIDRLANSRLPQPEPPPLPRSPSSPPGPTALPLAKSPRR